MRVIATNAIASITASTYASGYHTTNLLNSSPKKKWMAVNAAETFAAIDITTTGITGALALIGVVADRVDVSITDPAGINWGTRVVWPDVVWGVSPGSMAVSYELASRVENYENIWVSFPQFNAPVTIRIRFFKSTGNPETLACGVVQAGRPVELDGVLYPLAEGVEDYSIAHQLSNGATYHKQRDRVRVFSGQMRVDRGDSARWFMRDLARLYGAQPLLFHLAPPWGDDFVVYARFAAMPEASHDTPTYSMINFRLTEEL